MRLWSSSCHRISGFCDARPNVVFEPEKSGRILFSTFQFCISKGGNLLHLFVETEIRNSINTELASIEATLRTQLEDKVRRCLSTVAANSKLSNAPPSSTLNVTASPSLPGQPSSTEREGPLVGLPRLTGTASAAPHLNAEASASTPGPAYPRSYGTAAGRFSDSGCSSGPHSCQCSWHPTANSSIAMYGK